MSSGLVVAIAAALLSAIAGLFLGRQMRKPKEDEDTEPMNRPHKPAETAAGAAAEVVGENLDRRVGETDAAIEDDNGAGSAMAELARRRRND